MDWLFAALLSSSTWCLPPRELVRVANDTFQHGLANWRLEAEDPRAQVTAQGGVLDIQTPAGLSLWWHAPLQGDYAVRFTALALPAPDSAGALAGRLSDLNMFWNASEADGSAPRVRDGRFSSYDDLRAFYVGFGANGNTTTRLRSYEGTRRLLAGFAPPGSPGTEAHEQPPSAHTRLQAGQPVHVELVSRHPSATDPLHLRWTANGVALFSLAGPLLHRQGHFALRTTASRLQVRGFEIWQCQ